MTIINKNAALFLLLGIIILSGCSKDNSDKPSSKTNAELLQGKWQLVGATTSPARDYDRDGQAETDIFAVMKPCTRDMTFIFKTSGVWEGDEGELKCNTNDEQTVTGKWVLSGNQKTVTITEDGAPSDDFEILQLDDRNLKLKFSNVYTGSAVHQDILVFKRL